MHFQCFYKSLKNARLSEPPDFFAFIIVVVNDSEFMISNTLLVIAL